jgi:hypothetical protein
MTLKDIANITGNDSLASDIYQVTKDVARYSYFKMSVDLGVRFGPEDLSFTDMLLFSWIANRKKNG